jgi:hypothetical protein
MIVLEMQLVSISQWAFQRASAICKNGFADLCALQIRSARKTHFRFFFDWFLPPQAMAHSLLN